MAASRFFEQLDGARRHRLELVVLANVTARPLACATA
jgi:hypothetical protein